jgi:mannose-1-phosphate guanylyltransferase
MKALLLAAGFGTRLKPLTNHIPKCMVFIKNKPLLDFWIENLINSGINTIRINTHYLSNIVIDHIEKSEYKNQIELIHENKLLGTGGTLINNIAFFEGQEGFLIHADNLSLFNFHEFIKAHENRPLNTEITMMTFKTDNPQSCGIVNLDRNGIVTDFYEKSDKYHGNLGNAALFIIESSIFDNLETLTTIEIDFSKDVIPKYLNRIFTFENKIYHKDIGTVENYHKAQIDFNYLLFISIYLSHTIV